MSNITWSDADKARAHIEGWDVFAIDGDETRLEIQRLDEKAIFETDEQARKWVTDHKKWNHCARAIILINQTNRARKAAERKAIKQASSKLSRAQKAEAKAWEKIAKQQAEQPEPSDKELLDHALRALNTTPNFKIPNAPKEYNESYKVAAAILKRLSK